MAIKATASFSLKDHLFNKAKVEKLANEIIAVYPEFRDKQFVSQVVEKFPKQELLERLNWIRDCLREFLPAGYRSAVTILLQSLPEPLDTSQADDDYGDFIYGPYGAFVAEYGCTKAELNFSLKALKAMTKRFSVEFPIRSFINSFPTETMVELQKWATDKNYHVRRLASEGTRPKLPWAKKIIIDYKAPLPILDILHADSTRYVTRSVANHMNDISKIDAKLAIKTLKRWEQAGNQQPKEMDFIISHSLRTLAKQGNIDALAMLGYKPGQIKVQDFEIKTPNVRVGESLEFTFAVVSQSKQSQKILIDYHLYFKKANGSTAPKTFKIKNVTLQPGETVIISKRQPLRAMTTRVLHPGSHEVELQINGAKYSRKEFTLHTS